MERNQTVLFMGTPEFARASLEALEKSGYQVIGCFTNPDKPAGRGMKVKYSPVKEYAISKDIPIYQPVKLRNNQEVIQMIQELKPDVIAVVAYGKILPKEILEIPKYGCVNVHSSLLPSYRGAAPMQWAIINGEEKTGVTTMLMDVGMDTGDILLKEEIRIQEEDNLETIHDQLKQIGANLLVKTLDELFKGNIVPMKQGENYSMAPMITRETTHLDFHKKGRELFNLVRGLSPSPGTFIKHPSGKIFKVYQIEYVVKENTGNFKNGEVIELTKQSFGIQCQDGYIRIKWIQPENSKRMEVKSFLAGNKDIKIGDIFE